MKVRVIEKEGWYYSEYYDESARTPRWNDTFRNNNSIQQNCFKSMEDAIEECKRFAQKSSFGKVVWSDEM